MKTGDRDTTQGGPGDGEPFRAGVLEAEVRDYLERHPEFFARHVDLVEQLSVPHACGPAHSLIEHQVAVLRARNKRLDRRLRELIVNARKNEQLSDRLHGLSLRLLECADIVSLLGELEEGLKGALEADAAVVRLFLPPPPCGAARPTFVGAEHPPSHPYALLECLDDPFCGPLPGAYARVLFDWHDRGPASGVVVPFRLAQGRGLFAVVSRRPDRFQASMGTLFLQRFAGVLARALGRCLDAGAR